MIIIIAAMTTETSMKITKMMEMKPGKRWTLWRIASKS